MLAERLIGLRPRGPHPPILTRLQEELGFGALRRGGGRLGNNTTLERLMAHPSHNPSQRAACRAWGGGTKEIFWEGRRQYLLIEDNLTGGLNAEEPP